MTRHLCIEASKDLVAVLVSRSDFYNEVLAPKNEAKSCEKGKTFQA